jgi:hypothetical protein
MVGSCLLTCHVSAGVAHIVWIRANAVSCSYNSRPGTKRKKGVGVDSRIVAAVEVGSNAGSQCLSRRLVGSGVVLIPQADGVPGAVQELLLG